MLKIKFQGADGAEVVREFNDALALEQHARELDAILASYVQIGVSPCGVDAVACQLEADACGDKLQEIRVAKLAIHKPSNFEPSDYEVVDYLDNQPPRYYPPVFGAGQAAYDASLAEYRAARNEWQANVQRLFPKRHETGVSIHQCTHCGCRNVRYITAVLHKPTGMNIVFGSDCVERLNFANQSAFKAAQIKARAEAGHARMRIIAARAAFIRENPALVPAIEQIGNPVHAKNNFARDIIAKLNQYGSLSPRQVEALIASLARDIEYAARKANEAPKGNVPVGKRVEFSGVIISHKWQDNDFGGGIKMLVELENRSRVWLSAPAALGSDIVNGSKVSLRAGIEASKDDPSFGFGKRPHLISCEPPVAAGPRNNVGEGA